MLKLFTEFVEYQKQQQQAAAEKQELFTAFLEYQKSQKWIKLAGDGRLLVAAITK